MGRQRPRRVGVAENPRQVGNVLDENTTVGHVIATVPWLSFDEKFPPAHHLDVQAGRREDDVGFELTAGLQQDPLLGEGFDLVGDSRRLSGGPTSGSG